MTALDDLLHAHQVLQPLNAISNSAITIVVSAQLPMQPTDGGNARRIVRHGLADVLNWLGQDVGPKPGELIHGYLYTDPATGGKTSFVSSHGLSRIKAAAGAS